MRTIFLPNGKSTIVDDEDFDRLVTRKWYVCAYGYAVSDETRCGVRTSYRMHRVILSAPKGLEVDHINGNRLDNRRCNLRLANKSQNGINRPANRNNKSGFKGVSRGCRGRTWVAQIKVDGRRLHLGNFHHPEDAARAYDAAAYEHFGEYAYQNFKKDGRSE